MKRLLTIFGASYGVAWLLYLSFFIGPYLHQRVFYGNFRVDLCYYEMFLSPPILFVPALVGMVVAGIISFIFWSLLQRGIKPIVNFSILACALAVCLLTSFWLTNGELSEYSHGCL